MIHFTEEPTLKDYIAACKRRAWIVGAVLGLALLAGFQMAFLTTPQYRAHARVLVDTSTWNTRDYVERAEVPEVARAVELLSARVLSGKALATLAHRHGLYPELGDDPGKLAAATRKNVSTEITGFDQFTLSFVHPDPQIAAAVANELADAFVAEQRTLRETHGEKTISVMTHEIGLIARKLAEQGEQIKAYSIKNQGSLPGQAEGHMRAIERWQGDLRLNTQMLERAQQRLSLALASTPEIFRGEPIEAMRAEVTGLTAERAQLLAMIKGAEAKIARAAEVEGTISSMQREHDATLRTYHDALERRQAATLRVELDRSRFDSLFRVIEPAKAPLKPFKPARLLILTAALLFGLVVGAAAAIGVDWFDDTFHDVPALARVTGLPVLAFVPRHRRLLGPPASP